MFKRKRSKGQTMIYNILYRKVNIEEHIHINHCQIDYFGILWIEEDSITSRKKTNIQAKVHKTIQRKTEDLATRTLL